MSALGRFGRRLATSLRAFHRAEAGSTAIEYTIIAALLCTAIVASFSSITGPLTKIFADIGAKIASP